MEEDGSDDSGSERGVFESGGSNEHQNEMWELYESKKRKRKKSDTVDSRSDSERNENESYKVFIKLMQTGATFKEWNPIQLTKGLNKEVGEVRSAKVLQSGQLLVFCSSPEQCEKAVKVPKINGKAVEQGCPKYGPGANHSPRSDFMRPKASFL